MCVAHKFGRKICQILCFLIIAPFLGSSLEIATQEECSVIVPEGRADCGASSTSGQLDNEKDCLLSGCCWNETLSQCYEFSNCRTGYYGWRCHLRCNCPRQDGCNRHTGACDEPCNQGYWGVGCLLDNNCTYNDHLARHYTGSRQHTDSNLTCQYWSIQKSYELSEFPDKLATSLHSISNYCRNPKGSRGAFCYTSRYHWDSCTLASCVCPRGRYGPSCVQECHCNRPDEACDPETGECKESGCHPRWSGTDCSECADGYFGQNCEYNCKCHSQNEFCDKLHGTCDNGCATGWQGFSCRQECEDKWFGLNCDFSCNCQMQEEACNKATGACSSGCREGFGGEGCLTELPHLSRAPSVRNRNATSITINWKDWTQSRDKGTGPVGRYQVFFRQSGREDWIVVANEINAKLITVTDLSQESWYEFQVTPVHVTGLLGLPSPILNASTCGRPTSGILKMRLYLKTEREETLSASWEPPNKREHLRCISISGYNVYLTNSSNHSSLSFHDFVRNNSAHIRNIDIYQNLTVAITVVNNAGLESNPVFQTYTGRSGAVENLEAEAINSSTILLTWTPPKDSNGVIDSYLLTYRLVLSSKCKKRFSSSRQEQWTPFIDIDGAQNQMEISGLSVYSFYKFRIYPRTPSGKGKEEEVTGNTQAIEPVANLSLKLITINSKSAVVAWDAVECQNYNGEFVGYMYELYAHNAYATFPSAENLANESSADGQLYLSGVVNQTELVLNQLIPYLNYTLCIWFANHQHNGPKSTIALETHEDAPPAPKNVIVESKTSESLLVSWARPDPPQGLITKYSLRYFAVQNTRSASTTFPIEDVDVLSYNITKLVPFGHYGLQVRASTRIGDGPWSELVEEHTEETVPTEPLDLTNTSRSSKDIALQWKAPVHANGIIRFYSVTCSSANHLNKEKIPPIEKVVSPPSLNLTVDNLLPGINYVCRLSASTKKGEGQPVWCLLWTEPEISFEMPAPVLKQSQATDNLIIVDLLPSEPIDYMEEPDSLYRVVVEILPDEPFERKKRGTSPVPCDLGNSELVDHSVATARGLRCYIAAEIPRIVKTKTFIVGDNKTYGGYYNAKLSPDSDHDVWFGLVVTVDGVTVSSYAKTDQPDREHLNKNYKIKTTVIQKEQSESLTSLTPATGAVVGSLAAIALLALLIILLMYKILQKRKKNTRPSSVVMFDSNTDSISEQNAKLLPVEPPESPSKMFDPIPVSQLWDHVVPMRQSDYENLRAEFNEFRKEAKYSTDAAKRPENKAKNRYQNIYPYDHSRVILDCLPNEPNSDYINANYIDGYSRHGAFVAAQGPVENTVDDMWRMMWQLNSRVIIMVTNLQEGGRHKCKQYWPDAGTQHFGDIQAELQNSEEYADYAIRTFVVTKKGEKRLVKQFHFTTWPDHGIPDHPTSLLEFRKKVRSYTDDVQLKDPDCGPCLVHCSAGVGRTGCYIALDYSLDMAKEEGCVDVFNFVKKMRNDRVNMIQTVEQYIFVYEALLEALQAGVTSIPCSEFRSRYAKLTTIDPETDKSYLLEEYELLENTNLLYNQDDKNVDVVQHENKKNHNGKGIRSHLKASKDGTAVIFVDGYKHRKAFVVTTSLKDPSNFAEFWSEVVEHQCGAIICLEDQNNKEHHEVTYFPTSAVENLDFNSFSVKLISSDYSPYFDQQEFLVSHNSKTNRSKDLRVRRFKLKSWTLSYDKMEGRISLPTRSSILALLGALEKWQQYNGNSVVLVHCRDAATHSGIFCAGSFLIEKLKIEHEVDVFSSIRHIRVNRPQFIPNLVQYQYLYDLAIDYLDCFDTYANFESSI